jgi:hypothetical protein
VLLFRDRFILEVLDHHCMLGYKFSVLETLLVPRGWAHQVEVSGAHQVGVSGALGASPEHERELGCWLQACSLLAHGGCAPLPRATTASLAASGARPTNCSPERTQ